MKTFLKIVVLFAVLCYPCVIYFGMNYFSIRYLLLALACVFLLRFMILKGQSSAMSQLSSVSIVVIGLIVCAIGVAFNSVMMVKLYPVFINIILFVFFFHSLFYPPSAIERIARITSPDLSIEAIRYTRKVTVAWCGFFIANGMIALWSVFFASTKIWMLYNGFIAYFLMILLFSVEYLVRCHVKKQHEK
ncbi:MAG: hypothetical protein A3I77_01575 [Gammaproteobacteria bacterium RIFCSPLOWO2_02_FULL_42_14]|nr:MAG: hypothetical protein A3B71_07760 [Gammaproteobacteria bacterium RIFCSPHIGHO2_02_FULL_42_43]OGT27373.1 MAG: hypothetical protein A2624_05680 [Gammaproteobacteria bacterium RIFCSPHIGHO2_01_FULL_42_8]OGT52312.1 MAG: hypothetical protein A3E54_01635 [Gammaproteobacteria bacterium RIFCSPHIGHO2_12_FULL_41_25]OGT61924.1 MAG: hypothetical protein A3I77_01575 [Gammaproteobacteria bacterium RIFCSPLOWO2_02_FULL_42_14]OGT86365.1 MAG: hypothetical protein A3G86_07520 [Gammaproteobacteria bacterium R